MKAVFFDFDGVLTIDKAGSLTTSRFISKKYNIPEERFLSCYRKYTQGYQVRPFSFEKAWPDLCRCIGKDIDINDLWESYRQTKKNPQMFEIVETLRQRYKTGIITDNSKERFDLLKKELGLEGLFDSIIVSAEVGSTKRDTSIFEEALRSLDVSPGDAVFIDNTMSNVKTAQSMGIYGIFHDDEKNDIPALVEELKKAGIDI